MAAVAAILILVAAILQLQLAVSLHVTNTSPDITGRDSHFICKEALKHNLECQGVGSYPVAGYCDRFAVCTAMEVTPIVEFCPDGQIYEFNKCVESEPLYRDICPQKYCATNNTSVSSSAYGTGGDEHLILALIVGCIAILIN